MNKRAWRNGNIFEKIKADDNIISTLAWHSGICFLLCPIAVTH